MFFFYRKQLFEKFISHLLEHVLEHEIEAQYLKI